MQNIINYDILLPFETSGSTESEILTIIKNIKNSDNRDIYGLSNNLFKKYKDKLAGKVLKLINESMTKGVFPKELKVAVIKPIFKNGIRTDINNYRPIASLPIASKIFEYVIHGRLTEFFKKNKIISDYQFGFIPKSNTETATLHLTSTIYNHLENKKFTACLFLDIKKAFDSLEHNLFIDKLKKLNLPNSFLKLMISYFSDRRQCVEVAGVRSGFLDMTMGTFQGSVLGPLTFIFYINGIFALSLKGSVQAYADDLAVVYGENTIEELKIAIEEDLKTINMFLSAHYLAVNPSKTNYIFFHGRARMEYFTERSLSIRFENQIIERKSNIRYLGLVLDERLDFSAHIQHIANKITPMIYAIKRIRHFVSEKTLFMIYFSHIYSHLIFMNPIWNIANQENTNRLYILQKKVIKLIKKKPVLTPSHSLFTPRLLPVPSINEYHLLINAFKIKHNLIKNNVAIRYVNEVHNYNTRRRGDFYVYNFTSRYGYADFYRRGLIKYNELPHELKTLHTIKIFKNRISEYLFDNYQNNLI
jgi:hypothetical protein